MHFKQEGTLAAVLQCNYLVGPECTIKIVFSRICPKLKLSNTTMSDKVFGEDKEGDGRSENNLPLRQNIG